MISQSMRATAAAESRFRINMPNSHGRQALVLAIGNLALTYLAELQELTWNSALFGHISKGNLRLFNDQANNLSGLDTALNGVDVVVLLVTADSELTALDTIGNACTAKRIMTSGFVLEHRDDPTLRTVLAHTRKVTVSLVTDADTDAVIESLRALRA